MNREVTFTSEKDVDACAILELFRRNEWREWYTYKDTCDLINLSLFTATAWSELRAIGICTLLGDGRFYARVDTLLVDKQYRRKGIGTELVRMVMENVDELEPHYCELDTHSGWFVDFYKRFGFQIDEGPWLIHKPTEDKLIAYVEKQRAAPREKRGFINDDENRTGL